MDWEDGFSRRKLLYREWINIKVPLYSTRNYIHYPVINHSRKEYENKYIYRYTYICIYIYVYAAAAKLLQSCPTCVTP